MTHRSETVVLTPGKCRVCGCTETNACQFVDNSTDEPFAYTCCWLDRGKTLCSNPHCLAQVPMDELDRLLYPQEYGAVRAKAAAR